MHLCILSIQKVEEEPAVVNESESSLLVRQNQNQIAIMSRLVRLCTGKQMPLVGMGTWQMTNPAQDLTAIENALQAGYRHFDTAYKYENEEIVGNAIKKWLDAKKTSRDDLFVVTKLPWIGMHADRVDHFMNLSLKKLQLDYVDLYLVHWPFGLKYRGDHIVAPVKENGDLDLDMQTDLISVWKAMEKQVHSGKAKAIGISNFNVEQIERIMKIATVQPANLQVEVHAYFQQEELRKVCKKYGITITAYGPLGSPGRDVLKGQPNERRIPALMEDDTVKRIAKKHKKTPSQVLLRFLTQLEIVVIPKSSNMTRMTQNLNIFDFFLSDDEMEDMKKLDKGEEGRSFREFPSAVVHPEYPFPY